VNRRIGSLLALAFLAGSLLFGLAAHLTNPVLPEDDAYITYRYADNLLNGQGLVYNPGQRVFGSSTPLYVVWLAGIHSVARSVPTPDLAVRINFVFYALTIVGIVFLLTSLGVSVAVSALLAGLLAMRQSLLQASLAGMETFLFTGLLVWSLWALVTRRFRLSAWLAGLSVLARPEGLLMIVLFFTSWLAERRNWRQLVGLFVPGLVWIAFATPYFGTPVYHSLLAKSRPLYPLPPGNALVTLITWVLSWTVGGWTLWPGDVLAVCFLLLAVVVAAALFGYIAKARSVGTLKRNSTLAVPALLALFVLFYAISNPLLFAWYFPPVDCLWFTAITSGVVFAADWLRVRGRRMVAAVPLLGLLVLVAGPALLPLRSRIVAHRPVTDLKIESVADRSRAVDYRAVAEWLNRVVPPGDTVLAPEIGSLGYYYRGPVIDACGLVSPEALPFLPIPASERNGPGAISLELVKHLQSDVVVAMQKLTCRSLYPSDWFHQNYELVRQFGLKLPLRLWAPGGDTIEVFFRRGGRALQSWRQTAEDTTSDGR
jgi:arabinofuranosyltransferase